MRNIIIDTEELLKSILNQILQNPGSKKRKTIL
ncbi:MAG: hypothetical protein US86_C0006G0056 [Candidatus Daviesbacteria bacterium GW2011_GWA2_38_24]|uniref:Uncharacterized protein n=1 Tax=Candidatus Daviesbacteria bacterium GW2011_GWA2_38_24 TaxID=1618422 RepID=A0A0G0MNA1_9BACT|nr:MAG: hypothetical protein US86_C0006G0056 [Candidatus Daviesbacteria bacterium GW2011_GWA2_38_24]